MAKKFPRASEVTDKTPVAWRTSADIVEIYNAATGSSAKSLSASVREWVEDKADKVGWSRVYFPLAYPNTTLRAGAVFVKAVDQSVWVIGGRRAKKS